MQHSVLASYYVARTEHTESHNVCINPTQFILKTPSLIYKAYYGLQNTNFGQVDLKIVRR